MRRSLGLIALLSSSSALGACRAPATQVTIVLDTDAPAQRVLSLRVIARNAATLEGDASSAMDSAVSADASLWIESARPRIPGSFTVVPHAGGDRAAVTELELMADVGAGASAAEPAVVLRRRVRFRFSPQTSQLVRVHLSLRCGERSTGCTQTTAAACTVQQVCEERGSTCGERGRCVPIESPTVPWQPGSDELDASANGDGSSDAQGSVVPQTFAAVASGGAFSSVRGFAVDPVDDTLFVAVHYRGDATLFGRSLSAVGDSTALVRIEADGTLGWLKNIAMPTGEFFYGRSLAVTGSTLWMGGYYRGAERSLDNATVPAIAARQAALSCALDQFSGAAMRCFAHQGGSANTQQYRAAASNGAAVFGGLLAGSWPLAMTDAQGAGDDGFVTVYDADRLRFARRIASSDGSIGAEVRGVAIDAAGNAYAGGIFAGQLTVGGRTAMSNGANDGFVLSLDPNGAVRWVRTFGTSGGDFVRDLALGGSDKLYVVGGLGGNAQGLSELASFAPGAGGLDGYLIEMAASTGVPQRGMRFGTAQDDVIDRVALAPNGDVLLGGSIGAAGLAPLPAWSAPNTVGMALWAVSPAWSVRWARPLYAPGSGAVTAVAMLARSERVAFSVSLSADATGAAPSWAPSLRLAPNSENGVFGAFALSDALPAR